MTLFNRQPSLPPAPCRPSENRAHRVSAPPRPAEPLGHFAVVGVDQSTGQVVSTVIEARSEDDAQRIAQQQGILVDEFKPMHPLAGAAAVKLARDDPADRFNRPAHLADLPTAPEPRAAACSSSGAVGRPSMLDPQFSGRPRSASRGPLGSLGVAAVLALAGVVFYITAVRDGGLQQTLIGLLPGPQPAMAEPIDLHEPLGVDLAEVQGFEDWQYVDDLGSGDAAGARASSTAGRQLRLQAIIPATRAAGGHRGSAVIGGEIIRPGQTIAGYRLVLVREKHVLLQRGDRLIALRMSSEPAPEPAPRRRVANPASPTTRS